MLPKFDVWPRRCTNTDRGSLLSDATDTRLATVRSVASVASVRNRRSHVAWLVSSGLGRFVHTHGQAVRAVEARYGPGAPVSRACRPTTSGDLLRGGGPRRRAGRRRPT